MRVSGQAAWEANNFYKRKSPLNVVGVKEARWLLVCPSFSAEIVNNHVAKKVVVAVFFNFFLTLL
jgi:hypothetical protein